MQQTTRHSSTTDSGHRSGAPGQRREDETGEHWAENRTDDKGWTVALWVGQGTRIMTSPDLSLTEQNSSLQLYGWGFFFLNDRKYILFRAPLPQSWVQFLSRNTCSSKIYIKTPFENHGFQKKRRKLRIDCNKLNFSPHFLSDIQLSQTGWLGEEMLVWYATGYKPTSKRKEKKWYKGNNIGSPAVAGPFCLLTVHWA